MPVLNVLFEEYASIRLRSFLSIVAVALGLIATPLISLVLWFNGDRNAAYVSTAAQGLWSNGDRDKDNTSTGWWRVSSSSPMTPVLAASDEIHLVDVSGGTFVRDFVWSKTDGWKPPVILTAPGSPVLGAGPAIAHRGGGIFDLVVRGSDQYYHSFLAPGAKWSTWEPIGGMGGDPTVTTTTVGGKPVVDVWVQGQGSIWRRRWMWPSWQAWEEIGMPSGKKLVTSPGVVVRPGGIIDLVAGAAGDGQLYHAFFSPQGQFSGWTSIPGRTFSKPALTSPAETRLDLWVRGASDGIVYHSVWDAAATPSGWSGFETSIHTAPGTPGPSFVTGVAAVLAAGVTTIASVDSNHNLLVRSWANSVPSGTTPKPTLQVTDTLITITAENAVVVVPPSPGATQAECKDGGVIYSRGKSWDLERVSYACAFNSIGLQPPGPMGVCPATQITSIPDTGSNDSQIVRLNDGKLVWLYQSAGISTPSVPGKQGCKGSVMRGIERVRVSQDCGKTWTLVATLDPCLSGTFDASKTCNYTSVPDPSCWPGDTSPPSGTDRPELFASSFDNSVYMALGVAGTAQFNLHILKSDGAALAKWQDLDTGLGSGGAVAMAETDTHVYFARAEYGSPSNVGLYRSRKNAALSKDNFSFVGNLADKDALGNVQLSLLTDSSGDLIFRWAHLTKIGIRRGFSRLTPGGIVTLASDQYRPDSSGKVALPTLVASPRASRRAFLYWYEGTSATTGTYSVMGSMSDGVGRWSAPVTLGGPWAGSKTFTFMGQPGYDYLKGAYLSAQDTFLATWLQPDLGPNPPNRIGQAAVK